ncbi:uncharacterized protein LOC131957842 [Physella acuta]|uniref:uncharacterized protein LOC131957842 n=1 Tax=Physella acuta TaxID=109671 RepID=UPI0027DE2D88|nr:uncharacterized protein LOC131957842 [Physella acuta]
MGIMRVKIRWKMYLSKLHVKTFVLYTFLLLALATLYKLYNMQHNNPVTFYADNFEFFKVKSRKISYVERKRRYCNVYSLQHKSNWTVGHKSNNHGCRRVQPMPGSCDLADELFLSEPPASCYDEIIEFCKLKKDSGTGWVVTCNRNLTKNCMIGTIDPAKGSTTWEKTADIASEINSWITGSNRGMFGFCFIRCPVETEYSNMDDPIFKEQLLILPPDFNLEEQGKRSPTYNKINVNMILIDSVSRQHFYRSLKKSVAILENMKSADVFDFELVQAVRSRTFETLQTIFSGDVDPNVQPFGTQEIPPEPLKVGALFGKYKALGYRTLWLEDLCYLWEWGISKDLHFLNKSGSSEQTWARMWQKLVLNSIDSVGVTLAMCRVLAANNLEDHFHGPDSVCFNGRHQHEYLLDYLLLYQQVMEESQQPYLTFTMTNVGHEDTGRRIQTLDAALAKYLSSAASLPNTLTIVFSDHGNAYGQYIEMSEEARMELFHPFMFFLVPNTLSSKLGSDWLTSLGINTQRLVSFLDLHVSLHYLADPTYPISVQHNYKISHLGLFNPIDVNRTCNDIPRIMPNLCICRNFETPHRNNTKLNLFAYFAMGQLNNEIQRQFLLRSKLAKSTGQYSAREQGQVKTFQKCERLELQRVENLRSSYGENGSHILKMDLVVQKSEVFFVAVTIKESSGSQGGPRVSLEMYDRITPYSKFSPCADDVDLALCICDISKPVVSSNDQVPKIPDYASLKLIPDFQMQVTQLESDSMCLVLVTVKHAHGAVMCIANTCSDLGFNVAASIKAKDDIVYFTPTTTIVVLPGGMVVVGFIYNDRNSDWTSSLSFHSVVADSF